MLKKIRDFITEYRKTDFDRDSERRDREWKEKWDAIEASPRHNPFYPHKRGIVTDEVLTITQTVGDKTYNDNVRVDVSVEIIGDITILNRDGFTEDMLNRRDKNAMRIKDLKKGDRFIQRGGTFDALSDPYLHKGYWHINSVQIPQYHVVRKD